MELTNEQYLELRTLTSRIDDILTDVRGITSESDEDTTYWNKRMGVLAEVMLKQNVVTEEEWGGIGEDQGYDRRGLGGFFVGQKASMTKIGGNKRAITESGIQETRSWLQGHRAAKPSSEQMKRYNSLLNL